MEFYENVENAAGQVIWLPSWHDKKRFLSEVLRLLDSGRCLNCSFCHGDLNVDHVGVTENGETILLDWESAKENPIAVDLVDLERTCRGQDGRLYSDCEWLLCKLDSQNHSRELYSAPEQLFLTSLRKVNRWKEFFERFSAEGNRGQERLSQLLSREFGYANYLLAKLQAAGPEG